MTKRKNPPPSVEEPTITLQNAEPGRVNEELEDLRTAVHEQLQTNGRSVDRIHAVAAKYGINHSLLRKLLTALDEMLSGYQTGSLYRYQKFLIDKLQNLTGQKLYPDGYPLPKEAFQDLPYLDPAIIAQIEQCAKLWVPLPEFMLGDHCAGLNYELVRLRHACDKAEAECQHTQVVVQVPGLRLCDWRGDLIHQLKPGINVRVNRSGDPHHVSFLASVKNIHKNEEGQVVVELDLPGAFALQQILQDAFDGRSAIDRSININEKDVKRFQDTVTNIRQLKADAQRFADRISYMEATVNSLGPLFQVNN